MNESQVYLDLEETVITSWNEGFLMNVRSLKKWLHDRKVSKVNIFSFAIYDEKDFNDFHSSGMKESIERALEIEISNVLTLDTIQSIVSKYENFHYDSRQEFVMINGKHWAFLKYAMAQYTGEHVFLIDDAVPNLSVVDHERLNRVELINVRQLT